MTDGLEHPDLAAVGATMREEWRAEQDAAAHDAAVQWQHRRSLDDWLGDRMHAGDRIAVSIGNQRFTGLVEEIGPDLVGLRCVFARVDLHVTPGLPLHIEVVDHPAAGGARAVERRTFRDALVDREGTAEMSVGTLLQPDGIDGRLVVGNDFVSVLAKGGAETVVPLTHVAWVSVRRD